MNFEVLVFIAEKKEQFSDDNWKEEMYTIKIDIIQKWSKTCVTSKKMLYTIAQKLYNIEAQKSV